MKRSWDLALLLAPRKTVPLSEVRLDEALMRVPRSRPAAFYDEARAFHARVESMLPSRQAKSLIDVIHLTPCRDPSFLDRFDDPTLSDEDRERLFDDQVAIIRAQPNNYPNFRAYACFLEAVLTRQGQSIEKSGGAIHEPSQTFSLSQGLTGVVMRGALPASTFKPISAGSSTRPPPFITKTSHGTGTVGRREADDEVLNEALVGLRVTNFVRKVIPHFMYIYGAYRCWPVLLDTNTKQAIPCGGTAHSDQRNVYTMIETIAPFEGSTERAMTLHAWIKAHRRDATFESDLVALLVQILLALALINHRIGPFSHNDLHTDNIMVRRLPQPRTLTFDLGKGVVWYMSTAWLTTLIDLGRAACEVTLHRADQPTLFDQLRLPGDITALPAGYVYPSVGQVPGRPSCIDDAFRLLNDVIQTLGTHRHSSSAIEAFFIPLLTSSRHLVPFFSRAWDTWVSVYKGVAPFDIDVDLGEWVEWIHGYYGGPYLGLTRDPTDLPPRLE